MDYEALLTELARYEADIVNLESRFVRVTESLFCMTAHSEIVPRLFIASAVSCGRYEQHDSALSEITLFPT